MTAARVFLSYGFADRDFAKKLGQGMAERGTAIVDPVTSLRSGEAWASLIEAGIQSAHALVLVVPRAGTPGANNAFFELGVAHALGKPVLAVLTDAAADDLPVHLIDFIIVDASRKSMDAVVETLVHALSEEVAGAAL